MPGGGSERAKLDEDIQSAVKVEVVALGSSLCGRS